MVEMCTHVEINRHYEATITCTELETEEKIDYVHTQQPQPGLREQPVTTTVRARLSITIERRFSANTRPCLYLLKDHTTAPLIFCLEPSSLPVDSITSQPWN